MAKANVVFLPDRDHLWHWVLTDADGNPVAISNNAHSDLTEANEEFNSLISPVLN